MEMKCNVVSMESVFVKLCRMPKSRAPEIRRRESRAPKFCAGSDMRGVVGRLVQRGLGFSVLGNSLILT